MARIMEMRTPLHPAGVDSDDDVPEDQTELVHHGNIIDPQGSRVVLPPIDDGRPAETHASDQDLLDHNVLGFLDSVFGHGAAATLADGLQLAGNHIFFLAEKRGVLNEFRRHGRS